MKKDYRFHYNYKGKRREFHIMADSYSEAEAFFYEYIFFLQGMGLSDAEPERSH